MKKIKLIMTIFLLIVFFYSTYHIIIWLKDNNTIDNEIEEINTSKIIDSSNNASIDFESLKKKNKDTVAWLTVPGTKIDYPVVQTDDNQYYLVHSFAKKKNNAGWIFLDYRNDLDNQDKNTIIYGHARLDKSMFGTLKNTLEKSWYKNKENQIITLTTPNREYKFQTFSTYHIKTEDYYITTDFSNEKEYKKFINTLIKRSTHNFKIDVDVEDYILTLSTCYRDNQKVVLHAKLLNS